MSLTYSRRLNEIDFLINFESMLITKILDLRFFKPSFTISERIFTYPIISICNSNNFIKIRYIYNCNIMTTVSLCF